MAFEQFLAQEFFGNTGFDYLKALGIFALSVVLLYFVRFLVIKRVKEIPSIITGIFKKVNDADLDRVHFKSFGDFSLIFEIVYFVASNDYTKYTDIQQEINLEIKKEFEKEKIDMAFPTQTIYLEKS